MPYNGSGVASGPNRPVYPPAEGEVIYADYFQQIMDDVYIMLAQVLLRDGQTAATANISFGGFKLTNVADPTAPTDVTNKDYVDTTILNQIFNLALPNRVKAAVNIYNQLNFGGL